MDETVYSTITDGSINQGDIFLAFPLPILNADTVTIADNESIDIDIVICDVLVLSQSCDLVHGKIESLILAPLEDWETLESENRVDGTTKERTKKRTAIARGHETHLTLIHPNRPYFGWSVADFRRLQIVSVSYSQQIISTDQADHHFRMASPYREVVSQAVAKYLMRVALPGDLNEFESGKWPIDPT